MVMPRINYDDYLNDPFPNYRAIQIVIPSGTYVKKVDDKKYKVNAWRGMPKEYKEAINDGVIITYNQVKGRY